MNSPARINRLVCSALLCATLVGGCSQSDVGDTSSVEAEAAYQHELSAYVDAVEDALAEGQPEAPAERALADIIRETLQETGLPLTTDTATEESLLVLYAARGYAPIFTQASTLTDAGVDVAETILDAHLHGLDDAEFGGPELRGLLAQLALDVTVDTTPGPAAQPTLSGEERAEIESWLRALEGHDTLRPAPGSVAHLIRTGDARSPLSQIPESLSNVAEPATPAGATSLVELEFLLADAFVQWARAIRFDNENYLIHDEKYADEDLDETNSFAHQGDEAAGEDANQDPAVPFAELEGDERISAHDRWASEQALAALRDAILADDFGQVLRDLAPPFPVYARLVESARTYGAIIRSGGWATIDSERVLRPGNSYREIPAVRARLNAEHYWDGDLLSERYDAELEAAVELYQETHQLVVNGTIDEYTYDSFNVAPERRLAQIEATLGRWRTTRAAQDWDREHIIVNLPDFHGELWDGPVLVHRWATIVGALRRRRDETGEMRYWGATPLFSDTMEYIVYNPYWNVPGNIWRDEYAAEIEEDPDWLEDNNFEIITNEAGNEFLRQRPGASNALGLVKFLFPNEHAVYLHDTNRRDLFGSNLRAYSHGCIRVEDALELAALLMSRDQDVSMSAARGRVAGFLREGTEQWTNLRNPIPIHLDYFAVRPDEQGYTHFLADVYRSDRAEVNIREERIREVFETHRLEDEALRRAAEDAHIHGTQASAGPSSGESSPPRAVSATAELGPRTVHEDFAPTR